MLSSVTQAQYYVFYAVVACNKVLTVLCGVECVRLLLHIGRINENTRELARVACHRLLTIS